MMTAMMRMMVGYIRQAAAADEHILSACIRCASGKSTGVRVYCEKKGEAAAYPTTAHCILN